MDDSLQILQLNSMYGPVCEEEIVINELFLATPLKGTVELGEFSYYKFSIGDIKSLVTIRY